MQQIWNYSGCSYPRDIIFRKLFSRATFASQTPLSWIVTSYKALKLTMPEQCNIFGLKGVPRGTTAPSYTFLESSRRADVKLLTSNAATYRFRDIRGQMAKRSIWEAKNGPCDALFRRCICRLLKISPPKWEKRCPGHSCATSLPRWRCW